MGSVADLDHDRVEVDDRVEGIQRATLPRQHLLGDLVGDLRDRLPADLGADRGHQVMLDIALRHPAGIQGDDHPIQTTQTPRPFRHQRRGEGAVPIPRDLQLNIAHLGGDLLRERAVTRIRVQRRIRIALLITDMPGQLRLQATLQADLKVAGRKKDTQAIGEVVERLARYGRLFEDIRQSWAEVE